MLVAFFEAQDFLLQLPDPLFQVPTTPAYPLLIMAPPSMEMKPKENAYVNT